MSFRNPRVYHGNFYKSNRISTYTAYRRRIYSILYIMYRLRREMLRLGCVFLVADASALPDQNNIALRRGGLADLIEVAGSK